MFATAEMIRTWNENGKAFVPTFDDASQIPSGVNLGPTISVAGVLWYWSEYGVYAKAGSPPYVGATIPTATSARRGDLIQVDNAAVPLGRSILRCTGTTWAPPAGEVLAVALPVDDNTPIYNQAPGGTSLVTIWSSPVIPDYLLPNLVEFEICANVGLSNATGTAGAVIGVGISGVVPVGATTSAYPLAWTGTPQIYPTGPGDKVNAFGCRRKGGFRHGGGAGTVATSYDQNTCGAFVAGANKLWIMAKPSKTDDVCRFDGAIVRAKGNI